MKGKNGIRPLLSNFFFFLEQGVGGESATIVVVGLEGIVSEVVVVVASCIADKSSEPVSVVSVPDIAQTTVIDRSSLERVRRSSDMGRNRSTHGVNTGRNEI